MKWLVDFNNIENLSIKCDVNSNTVGNTSFGFTNWNTIKKRKMKNKVILSQVSRSECFTSTIPTPCVGLKNPMYTAFARLWI